MKANPEEELDQTVKIYEGASLTVKGAVAADHASLVEEVTFKFFIDGKPNTDTDKTIAMSEGVKDASGAVTVTHTLTAPVVPDDKDSYVLDYHVFYKVKNKSGDTEPRESLAVKKFEVVPRTAQLKVTLDADGTALANFQFRVLQGGHQVGGIQSTFALDTANAKGDTVPAGSAEFNLDLKPGFTIVQASPCEITEQTVVTGRKREAKGNIKFRAVFITPKHGTVKQYVNEPLESYGQTGKGTGVVITAGVEGDEDRAIKIGSEKTKVHFRVTFGPDDSEPVAKSKRSDTDFPTKVVKVKDDDTTATIDEKTANQKYEGNVTLKGGTGSFKVQLGVAGGDTCLIEIAGSDKFLTDTNVLPDQTLKFQNWRRLHYELMVADIMRDRVVSSENGSLHDLNHSTLRRLENLGKQLFIEFMHDGTQIFSSMESAGQGTLLRRKFLGLPTTAEDEPAYVLTGRNWRELPDGQTWLEKHPGKTLYMTPCDSMLQWRKDTKEPAAATKDYNGSFTTATGSVDIAGSFSGKFMPYSGDDGADGITQIELTADITKDDSCCKYTAALKIDEDRSNRLLPDAPASVPETYCVLATAALGSGSETISLMVNFAGGADSAAPFTATISGPDQTRLTEFFNNMYDAMAADVKGTKGAMTTKLLGGSDTGKQEDACFKAVKDFLNTKFDACKKDLVFHPGLDESGNPRTATFQLLDVTDGLKSTINEWHYVLPEANIIDGTPGPGSYVGATKTADVCPVKVEFSVQAHVEAAGMAEGKLLAWVPAPPKGDVNLVRFILTSLSKIKDDKGIAHGHSSGNPGDCLDTAETLCDACVNFGRSRRLEVIP
ncbi:MAG TPA: hypothetical protein VGK48_02550 [Terriglobia bacterium]|jgi:hypothetical protein